MNETDALRKKALGLLGIRSESHLELTKQIIATEDLPGELLADIVPGPLLFFSNALGSGNLREHPMLKNLEGEVAPEVLDQVEQISREEIPPVSEHPQYSVAISRLLSISKRPQQNAPAQEETQGANAAIHQVSSFPMLVGQKPPYLPVLKLIITTVNQNTLLCETINWGDLLFISHACLDQVLGHARNSDELIRNGLIDGIPKERLTERLANIHQAASELEGVLLQEHTEDDETK